MKHLICSLAVTERPYEKALLNGIESLSDSELLAIILRTGTKDVSALDLANQVLDTHITTKGLLGFAAGVMIALILLWDLFVLTVNSYDPAPLPVILLLTVPATLVIIGIVLALRERMKEIDGGEEDEAVNY